jgi:hypothetical protein
VLFFTKMFLSSVAEMRGREMKKKVEVEEEEI